MRARLLKPGFFTNERLARLPVRARLLFAGLWCLADREGRLEYRPERIKAAVFPYEPRVKIDALIRALELEEFVKRYTVAHTPCLALPRFAQHQRPHAHEPESTLPPPPGHVATTTNHAGLDPVTRSGRDQDQELTAASRQFARPPFKVYAAIAADVLEHDLTDDLGILTETFKRACAHQELPYTGELARKAIDAARVARARRHA
jgi:hypothetical protein